MKNLKFILAAGFILISGTLFAQKTDWKEMSDFHAVMSTTFHPAEENNFGALKEKAGELTEKAIAWKKSTVPAGYDATMSKTILKRLVEQCRGLKQAVNSNKPDAVLKEKITEAHETFHQFTEKCVKGEADKHK